MDSKIIDIGYNPKDKKRILVVDDESSLQSLFYDALAEEFQLVAAHTGAEGIRRAENMKPDLIFMDVMLPEINGFDAIKMLAANPITRDIPVIVMTAKGFDQSTVNLIKDEHNVCAFLPKPFRLEQLRSAIRSALKTPQ